MSSAAPVSTKAASLYRGKDIEVYQLIWKNAALGLYINIVWYHNLVTIC